MTLFKLARALGAVAALTAAPSAPAAPPGPLVGIGSDTTETLFDQLARDYRRDTAAEVVSYWATGTATLVPKPGCAPLPRPDGSSPGIAAPARRRVRPDGTPRLDFARSIAGRPPGVPRDLVYLPDAGPGRTPMPHRWAGIDHVGPCVHVLQQDQGTDPRLRNPDALVCYDVAKYLAQTVYHHADVHGDLVLGRPDGDDPVVVIPPSWICGAPQADIDIRDYGFLPLPANQCGVPQ